MVRVSSQAPHVHPPKTEIFDVAAGTNTDPKGFVRQVEQYRVEPFGLYMARPLVDHPRIASVQSWLLPELGLVASHLRHHRGHEHDWDTYLDIADVTRTGGVWHTVDHYLDIVLCTGRSLELLDVDELTAALASGLIDIAAAQRAVQTAVSTAAGLAAHGHALEPWLASLGVHVSWRPA